MRLTSARIEEYSASIAKRCGFDTVPLADSVASVTARLSRVVTCERAPSATCSLPTPSCALREDCVRAVMLACRPSAIARPAASSAPLLIRDPEDNWNSVLCRLLFVIPSSFCAASDAGLFRMLRDRFSPVERFGSGESPPCKPNRGGKIKFHSAEPFCFLTTHRRPCLRPLAVRGPIAGTSVTKVYGRRDGSFAFVVFTLPPIDREGPFL